MNPQDFTYSQLPVEPEDTDTSSIIIRLEGTGNVGVVPIPVSIQDLPDLGISLPHPSPNNLFLLNLGKKKKKPKPTGVLEHVEERPWNNSTSFQTWSLRIFQHVKLQILRLGLKLSKKNPEVQKDSNPEIQFDSKEANPRIH